MEKENNRAEQGSYGKGEPETVQAKSHRKPERYEGPVAPVATSILAVIAWSVFILVYALYWSTGFSLFQNVIVTIVSLMITGLLIGLMWVLLGSRNGWRG